MADGFGPGPYKGRYTLGEFWDEMKVSKMYLDYKAKNPGEAEQIEVHIQRKIDQLSDFVPIGITKTHFGNALLMVYMTLSAT